MPNNPFDEMADSLESTPESPSPGTHPAPVPASNPFDSLIDGEKEEQVAALTQAMAVTAKVDPDRRAKAMDLALKVNMPVDLVERRYDQIAERHTRENMKFDEIIDTTPGLAQFLEDPSNAAVARDDFDNLSAFESYAKQISTGWQKGNLEARSSELWAERLSEARAGGSFSTKHDAELARLDKDLEPLHAIDDKAGKNFHPLYQFAAQIPNMTRTFAKFGAGEDFEIGPAGKRMIEGAGAGMAVGAGAGALGLGVGAVPGAALGAGIGARVGGVAGMAQYAYQLEAGSAFKEYSGLKDASSSPINMQSAADAAHTVGMINAGLETAGDLILMKVGAPIAKAAGGMSVDMAVKALSKLKVPGADKIIAAIAANPEKIVGMSLGRAVREAGKLWALGMAGEVSTEFAQEVSTGVGKEAAKSASGQTFSENSGLVQIAEDATGVIYPTMQAMMIPGGIGAGAHFYNSTKQMRQAEIAKDAYSKLGEIAEQSKLKARLPQAHEKFVEEAVKGTGVESIQILPEPFLAYFQSKGLDGVSVAEELGVTEQLKEAVETGQKLVVPASVWMSKLGPTEHYKGLENDISFSTDAQSVNEAKEIHDELGVDLEAKATEATAPSPELEQEATLEESAAKVGENVATQLKAAGVAPADADAQALIHKERSKVRADLLGETPEAVFNRHNLEIRRLDDAQADDQAMGQSFNQEARQPAPEFYSKLERTITDKMGGSASVEQINGMLKEIKPEERKWLGLDEFLQGKQKVKKDELLAHIQESQIEIKEVVKGSTDPEAIRAQISELDDMPDSARDDAWEAKRGELFVQLGDATDTGTKFHQYTLPGGENYREILFTLPEKSLAELPKGHSFQDNTGKPNVVKNPEFTWFVLNPDGKVAGMGATQAAALADFQKVRESATRNGGDGASGNYRSDHWDEKNVLAHVRLNDRIDADGKRVLFVEEIQSDWHQDGRKKGYKGDAKPSPKLSAKRIGEGDNAYWEMSDEAGNMVSRAPGVYSEEKALEHAALSADIGLEQRREGEVPDAPFKKTWHEFALKKILRMAAEQGYDRVGWTTGEQQADRYSLAKKIDRIEYKPAASAPGSFRVTAIDKNEHSLGSGATVMTVEEIAANFGKEVAERISKGEGDGKEGSYKTLSGDGLSVGGEGMKGFYDKMVPDFLAKYGKKFGAKVGQTVIVTNPAITADDFKRPDLDPQIRTLLLENNEGAQVHSLDVTPAMKESVLFEGQTLFQGAAAEEARGRISFGKNKTIIDLFRSANLSTFLHEGGHLWLSEVGQDYAQLKGRDPSTLNPRQQRFLNDAKAILEYLGAESFESVTRDQHETFARSVEAYLMEGKAPSIALRKAFATFKAWLIHAYKKMAGLHVTLTPEIRSVMDRMLASEEEIAAVQREMKVEPLFTDPAKMGMSDKQTHKYLAAIFDAEESAKEELNAKLMADYARAQSAMYKEERVHVRAEVEKEVSGLPVYVAIDKIKANREVKLSRAALKELGIDASKALPRGVVATKAEGGLHPDVAAPLLGYASGSELVSALTSAQDKNALIERQTDDRMAERFPDLLTNGKLPEEALKAHHNQSRSTLLRLEMEHLLSDHLPVFKDSIRRVARRMPTDAQVREQAQAIIATKAVKDMRPHLYQRAEIRAAKAAGVALSKGDIEGAFSAKRSELLNHELFRATTQARETLEKSLEKFKKLSQSDEKLAKSRDMDLVNTARAILADIGIGKSDKPSSSYVEKIKRYDPDMFETVQALIEGVSGKELHFSQLSYGEFLEVKDAIDALWGLSKSTRQIEISGQILDRQEVIADLSAQVGQITEPKAKAGYQKAVSNWDKAKIKLLSAAASLTRVEAFVEAADLGAHNGPFRKYIWNPVSEATTKYRLEKQALMHKYAEILNAWAKGLERKPIEAAEIGYTFRDKAELMMAVLHAGNDSNLDKLLRGRNWGEQNPEGVTDRSRFDRTIARLQAEGVLTKQDYDFAQSVWDLLDETKTQAQKAHKAIHGHYFNEVTANEVVTPYGVYRGGYIPAKVDVYTTEDASIRSEREAFENNNNSFQFPTTGRGFTKSRTQQYAAPLSLEMSMLAGHLDGVLRFSYIEPTVRSVARITQDKGFRETLSQLDPTVGKELLTPWLQRAAQQKVVLPSDNGIGKALDSVASYLRRSVAMQIMVGSVTNTLQQFTGVVVAASKVKPMHLRNALATYVRDIKGTSNSIMEKSEWMRSTQGSTIYESQQAIEQIILDPSTFENIQNFALRHTYFLQTAAQNIVNTVVWTGAYEQAVAAKLDEKSAVLQADAAVRMTQGTNNPEDISRFETGTATARLFTQFAGYFNMLLNLNASELQKISRDVGLKKGAGRAFYLYSTAFMIPAVLSGILVQIMGGKGLDEDDDGYLNDMLNVFFGSQVRTAFALIPYGGQALNASLNSFNGNRNDDRISLSPVVSFIETMTGVPAELYKSMNGENVNNKRVVKDVLTFLGTASALPIGPLGKPVGYLMDVSEGKAQPSGPIDTVRGLVTGKSGKAN